MNTQDFLEFLTTVLSIYYALTMKRTMQRASFTPTREESPVYAIIFRSFSFFSYPLHNSPRISFTLPIGSRRAAKPLGAEKRRSCATATRTIRRSQQVLSSRRRHCHKKIRRYGQKKRENVFVLGFHVRVKLNSSQRRASRMISDAYCIRSNDDDDDECFFPFPVALLVLPVFHLSALFPPSTFKLSVPCPRMDQSSRKTSSRSFSLSLLFLSPFFARIHLLFL